MILRNAYPKDPSKQREKLKQIFRHLPFRGLIAFLHCYIFKFGFLDNKAGLDFALSRMQYYRMVRTVLKTNKDQEKNDVIEK